MKVIDEIVYADDFSRITEVTKISALENYMLYVEFNDGSRRIFDFTPLLDYPVFQPLRDKDLFSRVAIIDGIPTWQIDSWETDISPDHLLCNGIPA